MAALLVLLAAGFGLLALGAVRRVAPRRVPALQAAVCLAGLVAALLSSPAVVELGLDFAIDGVSCALLVPLLLLGACAAAGPVTMGALVLALLAADAVGAVLFLGVASGCAPLPAWVPARRRGPVRAMLPALVALALLCVAVHGGWPTPRFAAMRTVAPGLLTLALLPPLALAAAVAAAATLPPWLGAVVAVDLLARLLLDLPGVVTPGWWGVLLLLAGSLAAALLARHAASVVDPAASGTALATTGLAAASLGVALLARAADLPPLTSLAVSASLLLVLATALSGAVLLRGSGRTLPVRGDLTRRGAALLALASVAALPPTLGFAAAWLYLQALLGAARLGGTATLAVVAAALAATGLALAFLAVTALRLAGRNRGDAAAAPATPDLATAALALGSLVLGLIPAAGLFLVAPGVRLLAGVPLQGSSVWGVSVGPEWAGYPALGVAVPLLACTGAAAWLARSAAGPVPAWHGGLGGDGTVRADPRPLLPLDGWREWRPRPTARSVLLALALALAATLGWAAR